MSRIVLLFALVLAIIHNGRADEETLTVYYESKCNDSADFIINKLYPTMIILDESTFNLKLVPFGKATSINNHGEFKCQHGPSECLGNLVQECALDAMNGRSNFDKVSYVYCEMEEFAGAKGSLECVKRSDIPVKEVEECMSSNKGTELQLASEHATKSLSPKFIPTITINGVFDQAIQNTMLIDPVYTLCSRRKENDIDCGNYNGEILT